MGRSSNLLRILWPFDTSLGNNQTFATQEYVNGIVGNIETILEAL